MKYSASDLRLRVSILRLTYTEDEYGENQEVEENLGTVWAAKYPRVGREAMRAERIDAEERVMYVMRYRKWVTADMRLQEGDEVFEIHNVVDVDGRKEYLELVCTRRTDG